MPKLCSCISRTFNCVLPRIRKNVTQVERGSLLERGVTLLLVFLQLYPQYRALRIIFMRFLTFLISPQLNTLVALEALCGPSGRLTIVHVGPE